MNIMSIITKITQFLVIEWGRLKKYKISIIQWRIIRPSKCIQNRMFSLKIWCFWSVWWTIDHTFNERTIYKVAESVMASYVLDTQLNMEKFISVNLVVDPIWDQQPSWDSLSLRVLEFSIAQIKNLTIQITFRCNFLHCNYSPIEVWSTFNLDSII